MVSAGRVLFLQETHSVLFLAEQPPLSGGRQVRFYQQEGRLRSLGGPPQKQAFSPRSAQSSSFNSQPEQSPGQAVRSSPSRLPATPKFSPSTNPGSRTSVQKAGQKQKPAKGAAPAKAAVHSFSFSAAARSGPQKISSSNKGPIASSASLFSPVGPAPRGNQVRMQTYARAPAKKVSVNSETKASRLPFGGKLQHSSQKVPAGNFSPRFSTAQQTAPGFAPAKVFEIPQSLGGWPIRRLGDSTNQNQVEVQKPQLKPAPPPPPPKEQVEAFKTQSLHPASKWSRVKIRSRL